MRLSEAVPYTESCTEYASAWEAPKIPLKQRMRRLFPSWTPKTKSEVKRYITTVKVPILTLDWKKTTMPLTIHKKLSNEYIAIFQDMCDAGIKTDPKVTWGFNRRRMRKWSQMSHHSYWSAVDLNWNVNWWVYWKTDTTSPYFNDEKCVNIRKKHWFYRWWDWSKNYDDPMHFTYMNA